MEIQGYSNYLIYEDGRVYSKKKKIFLKGRNVGAGYLSVVLWNDKKKQHYIHRLVALHYIPNPENKPEVDHINRDKKDNRVDNLRWVTRCENKQNLGLLNTNTTGIKNICPHKNGGYNYEKKVNKKKHTKYFKTLEEAIEYKKEYEKSLQIQ
tara:strand:- start:1530 stop:1985 length:456 start_codon:yes stop_codon:yes gene_type:complete